MMLLLTIRLQKRRITFPSVSVDAPDHSQPVLRAVGSRSNLASRRAIPPDSSVYVVTRSADGDRCSCSGRLASGASQTYDLAAFVSGDLDDRSARIASAQWCAQNRLLGKGQSFWKSSKGAAVPSGFDA
jgi:hypothetical protein